MNLSAWSIKHPTAVLLLFAILLVTGIAGFGGLKIQNFPDIEVPSVRVTVSLPGASPDIVEVEITRKIEDAVSSLPNIDEISSTVTEGSSSTVVSFELGKDVQVALNEVRDSVSQIRSNLPPEIRDPVIAQVRGQGTVVISYSVKSKSMDIVDLSNYVDTELNRQLSSIEGVNSVSRQGGSNREIEVLLNPSSLAQHQLTAFEVSRQIQSIQRDASAGQNLTNGKEQSLRIKGLTKSASELEELRINAPQGVSVRLKELGRVLDSSLIQKQAALLNEEPVVAFQVTKNDGSSEVSIKNEIQEKLSNITSANQDLEFKIINDRTKRVEINYAGSMQGLLEGALLAIVVVWFFLRDSRATFIAAVALPLSILPAFAVMYLIGYSLNGITLISLTLVTGILVDDAIVEVENIVRHMQMGKSPLQAAFDATDEIGMAVVATTLTIVAVFLPTAFMPGIPGLFFEQFGWTASIAVLASLLVARMLTPVMAAYMLKPASLKHEEPKWISKYLEIVDVCLKYKKTTIFGTILFFAFSIFLATKLPTGFIPQSKSDQVIVTLENAPGTSFEETFKVAQQARSSIKEVQGVLNVFTTIGAASFTSNPDPRSATLIIQFDPEAKIDINKSERAIRSKISDIPGIRASYAQGGGGQRYQLTLVSNNPSLLNEVAQEVQNQIRQYAPGLGTIRSSAALSKPEIVITPNTGLLTQLGLTTTQISQLLRVSTAADFEQNLSKLNLDERQIPIKVRIDPDKISDLEQIKAIMIPTNIGMYRLDNLAKVSLGSSPTQINRYDRSRNISITVDLEGRPMGEVSKQVLDLPIMKNLPEGVSTAVSGDARGMRDLFLGFGMAMLGGIFCIYAVLVLLFNQLKQPFVILATLPMAAAGAFFTLYVADFAFTMPALIGLLMLMGIVTKNSILLVDYAIEQSKRGSDTLEAIKLACSMRARPIIMTTIAMTAGMIPLAAGLSGDPSFRVPMAVVVIGGLCISTALSLFVIPILYAISAKNKKVS